MNAAMKRRDFLRTSLTGIAALGLSPALLRACTATGTLHDFGIISGVLSNELRDDPKGTLEAIAEMGYKYLEFGGTFGMKTGELKRFLSGIGLKPLAGGTNINAMMGDELQELIDAQLAMDKKYLVCYWPWRNDPNHITMDDLKFAVEQFHRIGEACNKQGLRFAYHNHDHEFQQVGDGLAYDYYMQNTDPSLVTMQLDLYWASVGGVDPAAYLVKYPGRFEILHVKDAYDLDDRESFACVGDGVIDFERILQHCATGGVKYLVVEKDGATQGISCAQTSIDHLNSLDF